MSVEGSLHVTGDISGGAMTTFDQRVTSLEQEQEQMATTFDQRMASLEQQQEQQQDQMATKNEVEALRQMLISGNARIPQRIPTNGALDWEHFTIDGAHYLAVANYRNGDNYNSDSVVYVRGVNGQFEEFQRIPTSGAYDWKYFTIDGAHYLAVANHYNGNTYNIDSVVYRQHIQWQF